MKCPKSGVGLCGYGPEMGQQSSQKSKRRIFGSIRPILTCEGLSRLLSVLYLYEELYEIFFVCSFKFVLTPLPAPYLILGLINFKI